VHGATRKFHVNETDLRMRASYPLYMQETQMFILNVRKGS